MVRNIKRIMSIFLKKDKTSCNRSMTKEETKYLRAFKFFKAFDGKKISNTEKKYYSAIVDFSCYNVNDIELILDDNIYFNHNKDGGCFDVISKYKLLLKGKTMYFKKRDDSQYFFGVNKDNDFIWNEYELKDIQEVEYSSIEAEIDKDIDNDDIIDIDNFHMLTTPWREGKHYKTIKELP
ncbi:MAG: hypothetical protein LBG67_05415 [Campylobacteraceae bacterium]|jgi:hypothetical protein|nr:hypothetical protein [Campylobacteraceae bacterium]